MLVISTFITYKVNTNLITYKSRNHQHVDISGRRSGHLIT